MVFVVSNEEKIVNFISKFQINAAFLTMRVDIQFVFFKFLKKTFFYKQNMLLKSKKFLSAFDYQFKSDKSSLTF